MLSSKAKLKSDGNSKKNPISFSLLGFMAVEYFPPVTIQMWFGAKRAIECLWEAVTSCGFIEILCLSTQTDRNDRNFRSWPAKCHLLFLSESYLVLIFFSLFTFLTLALPATYNFIMRVHIYTKLIAGVLRSLAIILKQVWGKSEPKIRS